MFAFMIRHIVAVFVFGLVIFMADLGQAFADGDSGNSGSGSSNSGSGSSNSGSGNSGSDDDDDDDDDRDDDNDHQNAKSALDHNEIRPLQEILAVARARVPGRVLAVSLLRRSGRLVYRIRVLAKVGRKHELLIDGQSKRILRIR
jgi:hypothetical protein